MGATSRMPDSPTCTWTGSSGTTYTYYIHQLPVSLQEAYGNYIYSKASAEPNRWLPIYIGEGDLADRIGSAHHQATCIRRTGATHVHVHTTASKNLGQREEKDLLGNYTNAYQPQGCNVKPGG